MGVDTRGFSFATRKKNKDTEFEFTGLISALSFRMLYGVTTQANPSELYLYGEKASLHVHDKGLFNLYFQLETVLMRRCVIKSVCFFFSEKTT